MKTCCPKMEAQIEQKNIDIVDEVYFAYGKPEFVDDGHDFKDNMTPNYILQFCPFCGGLLKCNA